MYCNADVTRKTRGIGCVQNVGTPGKKKKKTHYVPICSPLFPIEMGQFELQYPGYPPCLISMSRHQRFPRRLHSAGCVEFRKRRGFAHPKSPADSGHRFW